MHIRAIAPFAAALALLAGCAATISQDGLEQRTAQAIGRTVGQFAITDRSEEAGGRINYTASTRDGATYRCYLYGATGLQRAVTFGQTPHSDAICTAMARGQAASGSERPAATGERGRSAGGACNALLRAAGRC
ncbi:MAG: hypothetical protein V4653_08335 [Pseudomonadota bacterium]